MKKHLWLCAMAVACVAAQSLSLSAADPSGTWKWQRTFQEREVEFTLRLKLKDDKLTGTFKGLGDEDVAIENGAVKGEEVSFEINRDFNGNSVKIAFQGTVADESIKGNVELSGNGQSREFEWEAKRSTTADDVVGTWEFTSTGPDGQTRTTPIKISKDGDDLKATFNSDQLGEVGIDDVTISDNTLTLTLEGEQDGNSYKITSKGKPRGDKMSGTTTFEFNGNTGEIEFTAKRTAA